MQKRIAAAAVVMSLTLGGWSCSAQAQATTTTTTQTSVTATTPAAPISQLDRQFVFAAMEQNLAEIQLAQLAMQKSRTPNVQSIAKIIQQDHTLANTDLTALASNLGLLIPSQVNPRYTTEQELLSRLSGPAFDNAYVRTQLTEHSAAIDVYKGAMASASNPQVRNYASTYLPRLQAHYQLLSQLLNQLPKS